MPFWCQKLRCDQIAVVTENQEVKWIALVLLYKLSDEGTS